MTRSSRRRPARSARSLIGPGSWVAAFSSRFTSTWRSIVSSTSTGGRCGSISSSTDVVAERVAGVVERGTAELLDGNRDARGPQRARSRRARPRAGSSTRRVSRLGLVLDVARASRRAGPGRRRHRAAQRRSCGSPSAACADRARPSAAARAAGDRTPRASDGGPPAPRCPSAPRRAPRLRRSCRAAGRRRPRARAPDRVDAEVAVGRLACRHRHEREAAALPQHDGSRASTSRGMSARASPASPLSISTRSPSAFATSRCAPRSSSASTRSCSALRSGGSSLLWRIISTARPTEQRRVARPPVREARGRRAGAPRGRRASRP